MGIFICKNKKPEKLNYEYILENTCLETQKIIFEYFSEKIMVDSNIIYMPECCKKKNIINEMSDSEMLELDFYSPYTSGWG